MRGPILVLVLVIGRNIQKSARFWAHICAVEHVWMRSQCAPPPPTSINHTHTSIPLGYSLDSLGQTVAPPHSLPMKHKEDTSSFLRRGSGCTSKSGAKPNPGDATCILHRVTSTKSPDLVLWKPRTTHSHSLSNLDILQLSEVAV